MFYVCFMYVLSHTEGIPKALQLVFQIFDTVEWDKGNQNRVFTDLIFQYLNSL